MVNILKREKPYNEIKASRQISLPIIAGVLGLAMNICGKLAMQSTGLPLYLDTIGTIMVSALGGFLPGITVALCTNILSFFIEPTSIYYDPLNILIAIITVVVTQHGWLKGFWKNLLYVFILACIGGGIGGLLYWYLNDDVIGLYNKGAIQYLMSYGYSKFWAYYVVNFGFDFLDKLLTVQIVKIILFLLPKKNWTKFKIILWQQNPLEENEQIEIGRRETRGLNLNKKIIILLVSFSIGISIICTTICYWIFINYVIEQHKNLAIGVAKIAASTVDAESVELYLEDEHEYASYTTTEQMLTTLQNETPDVNYVYVYKITSDGCIVIFDVDENAETRNKLGDVITFDPSFKKDIPLLLSGNRIEPVVSNDQFGWLLTAYEPVYDSYGDCVCYAGVDITMVGIQNYEIDFIIKQLCIFSGFLFFFIALSLTIAKYHLILPIESMAEAASNATYEDEEKRIRSQNKLAKMNIRTGDEIENLYKGLLTTAETGVKYYASNQRRAEAIEKMQISLVSLLADLVENRDGQVAGNSKKTSEIVMAIARSMGRLGYYGDFWNEKYIRDLGLATPLHDIGKMTIPESILNKEGALTEEEFEIMKTHTNNGARFIENAIEQMPDVDYLELACDMAFSHHERWDGNGYPVGIAGEEIPLSARIMSVADVFDAVTTDRVYKKSISVDEAFELIEAEAGRQFDPLVVDAFLRVKDEIIKIVEEKR